MSITLFGRDDLRITPQMVLVNYNENCPDGVFSIEIFDDNNQSLGDVVNYQQLGQSLTFRVTEANTANNCSGKLELLDEFAPEINCTELFIACYADTSPAAVGYPEFSDNIDELSVTDFEYEDRVINLNCLAEHNGTRVTQRIDRDWWLKDASGNEAHCTQTIFLQRADLADIIFPQPLDDIARASLDCADSDTNLDKTGHPTIDGKPLGDDICDFSVAFTDRKTEHCAGSYTLNRIWSIIDLCTAEERRKVQVIEVTDKTAPIISCPDTIYATVRAQNCRANVTLTEPEVTDDCGLTTTLVEWEFGTGIGTFNNVYFGSHEVTYTATDACGNAASCVGIVVVTDETKPTTLCDDGMEVSLNPTGEVIAPAELFDNGSSDNCGIEKYEVSREGGDYVETLTFDCQDVANSPIPLTFRVTDVSGNWRECEMEVFIVDMDAPVISCPDDINIKCAADYKDVLVTGQASASDACGLTEITYSDTEDLNQCGLGVVRRLWHVKDINGNASTCEQIITIEAEGEITVEFPEAVELYSCGADISADSLGRPVVSGNLCSTDYGIDYTDNVFGDSPPACYTIYRRWTVVDLCKFVPNTPDAEGRWEQTQVIEVYDTLAPVFDCIIDQTASVFDGGCEMFVEVPLPTVTDCSPDIIYANDSDYADGEGANASGVYPVGEHTITYTATDGCGNVGTCIVTLLVRDEAPPVPICFNGVTIPLNENGLVFITPNMISAGANDNCFPADEIELSVTPARFDCDDLGTQEVTLRAEDPMGNFAICIVDVTIQDNIYNCTTAPEGTAEVSGLIRTSTGETMAEVTLQINGNQEVMATTDDNGSYRISDLPMYDDYTIQPVSADDYKNGVSTFDLIKIRKHILGLETITDPYKLIAGDVNNSGSISTFDMVTLRKLILGIEDELAQHPSWVFVKADYDFPSDMNPAAAPYPQLENINNLDKNHGQVDFIAIKIGDMNGTASTNFNTDEVDERSGADDLNFLTENVKLVAGYEYEVPIYAQDFYNIEGFQLTFDYDTNNLEWLGIEANALPRLTNDHFYEVEPGKITLSWEYFYDTEIDETEPLFTLRFTATHNSTLQNELKLTPSHLSSEAYTYDENLLNLNLLFTESQRDFYLLQNTPNPFRDATSVHFKLPKATEVTLTIYDLHGRQIQQYRDHFSAGQQGIDIQLKDINTQGILYYTLTTPITRTISGKMLRINE
ncbi:MAG: HYR domain-containing protein [Saprospiraceae bacterium]